MARTVAAIIPFDTTQLGLWRGEDLLDSLACWEPDVRLCVLLADGPDAGMPAGITLKRSRCEVVVLRNDIDPSSAGWQGDLTSGILAALRWIHSNADVDFVLRIDNDALVIGPFATRVREITASSPDAGIVGSLGFSCNPAIRHHENLKGEARLVRARRLWPPMDADQSRDLVTRVLCRTVSSEFRLRFQRVRPHIDAAMCAGYALAAYCQGGACVITRRMLDRLVDKGYLEEPDRWRGLPLPDDHVLAMYAAAVGTELKDASASGEPFGVQSRGLAFPLREMLARKHSIIHSIRNDPRYTEQHLRELFRSLRTWARRTATD